MLFTMKRIGVNNDPLNSQPSHQAWKWPLNLNTQKFCPNSPRVSLVGNPVIYWINLAFLLLFLVISMLKVFHSKRGDLTLESRGTSDNLLLGAGHLFLAYVLHYLPFFKMDRQLYIHHYYPAFYFSCLLTAVLGEYLLSRMEEQKSVVKESS